MSIALYKATVTAANITKTFAHDSGTGDNRLLIVKVNSTAAVSAVTYAGVALTNTDGAASAMTVTNATWTQRTLTDNAGTDHTKYWLLIAVEAD